MEPDETKDEACIPDRTDLLEDVDIHTAAAKAIAKAEDMEDFDRNEALKMFQDMTDDELKRLMVMAEKIRMPLISEDLIDACVDQAIEHENHLFPPKEAPSAKWNQFNSTLYHESKQLLKEDPDRFFKDTTSLDQRVVAEAERLRKESEKLLVDHFGERVAKFLEESSVRKSMANAAKRKELFLDWSGLQEEMLKKSTDTVPVPEPPFSPDEKYYSAEMTEWDLKHKMTFSPSDFIDDGSEEECQQSTRTE